MINTRNLPQGAQDQHEPREHWLASASAGRQLEKLASLEGTLKTGKSQKHLELIFLLMEAETDKPMTLDTPHVDQIEI